MRSATKYLIKLPEGIFGYDSPEILRIDIAQNKPKDFQIFIQEKGIALIYKEISLSALAKEES